MFTVLNYHNKPISEELIAKHIDVNGAVSQYQYITQCKINRIKTTPRTIIYMLNKYYNNLTKIEIDSEYAYYGGISKIKLHKIKNEFGASYTKRRNFKYISN